MSNQKLIYFLACLLFTRISADELDDAISSLDKLRDDVLDSVDTSLKGAYTTMSQTLDSTTYNIVSESTTTILNNSAEFLSQYEDITQAALDEGLDITECFNAFDDRFRNLGLENVERLEECVKLEIASCIAYISSRAVSLVEDYFSLYIYDLEKGLLSCLGNEHCVNYVANEIGVANDEFTSKFAKSVGDDQNGLTPRLQSMKGCADTYIASVNGVGEGMLAGLQMCIDAQRSKKH